MSTNKVYGDVPNELPAGRAARRGTTTPTPADHEGIDETCRVDRCTHSLFGVSKLAGDVMTQEYGRYFGMKTGVFRGGCLTGPFHSAVAAARVPRLPGPGRPPRRDLQRSSATRGSRSATRSTART